MPPDAEQPSPPTARPFRDWVPYLIVAALTIGIFAPLVSTGFFYDDEAHVCFNRAVRELSLSSIFGQGYWSNVTDHPIPIHPSSDLYRPLTTLSVALSHQLFGQDPFGYHVENILFHALATTLVLALLRAWNFPLFAAGIGAALFGVAPIHIEPVASIILRNEILSAIFSLLALLWIARGRHRLAPLAYFAALLTKESAVALPVIAALVDHTLLGVRGSTWRQRLPLYGSLVAATLAYLGLRYAVLGKIVLTLPEATYFGANSTLDVWLTMARFAVEHYVSATVLGTPIIFDYSPQSIPLVTTDDTVAWALLIAWIGLAGTCIYAALRRRSAWAVGPLFFLLALGPTSNLLTRIGVIGASRLAYFPQLGFALLLTGALAAFVRSRTKRTAQLTMIAGSVLVLAYATQTWRRIQPFHDLYELQLDVLSHVPQNGHVGINAGNLAAEIANGKRTPPPRFASRSKPEWITVAHGHYEQALRAAPVNFNGMRRMLLFTAVESGRMDTLPELLDLGLRAQYRNFRPAPLPAADWTQFAPLRPADRTAFELWSAALQPLRNGDLDNRLIAALAAQLPDYFELRALRRSGAGTATTLARAQQLRQSILTRLQGLHPMLDAMYGQRMNARTARWLKEIEGRR